MLFPAFFFFLSNIHLVKCWYLLLCKYERQSQKIVYYSVWYFKYIVSFQYPMIVAKSIINVKFSFVIQMFYKFYNFLQKRKKSQSTRRRKTWNSLFTLLKSIRRSRTIWPYQSDIHTLRVFPYLEKKINILFLDGHVYDKTIIIYLDRNKSIHLSLIWRYLWNSISWRFRKNKKNNLWFCTEQLQVFINRLKLEDDVTVDLEKTVLINIPVVVFSGLWLTVLEHFDGV